MTRGTSPFRFHFHFELMHCERFQIGDTLNLEVAFGPFTVSPPPVLFCVHVIVQSVPLQEVHA